MDSDSRWWNWLRRRANVEQAQERASGIAGRTGTVKGWPSRAKSRRPELPDAEWTYAAGSVAERSLAVRLHRFLRDNVPILKAVIWTWTRLATAPRRFEISGVSSEAETRRAYQVLDALDRRIHPDRIVRFGGFDGLLVQYFDTLFTEGAVAGELTILPSHRGLDRFEFVDTATLDFESDREGHWRLYQRQDDRRVALDSDAIFYQPLDAEAGRPLGKSLLSAVGFVARVEQELVRDMQKAMHNAGYNRLHVRIKPPGQGQAESESDYTSRANAYFDSTVRALQSFDVDDNPVTWDDVEISHVGPANQVS